MVYILIALIFGAVSASIAYDKGRNSVGWFLTGLMIGPFSLVVLAMPSRPRQGRLAECPACLEVVRDEASICRYCGTALE